MTPVPRLIVADVLTLDPERPRAEAVLVAGERVLAVGARDELQAMAPRAELLDLRGQVLTPGLTDSHVHLTAYGFSLERLALGQTRSPDEAAALVKTRTAALPAGAWVLGSGYDRGRWGLDGYPEAAWLDRVAPEHPVLLSSRDGHGAWASSLAMRLASLHEGTPDPPGGRVVRDERGRPTGALLETAIELVRQVVPSPDYEASVAAARRAAQDLAGRGFTAVHTMALEPADSLRAMLELEARGELPLRVWACLGHARLDDASACGMRGGTGGAVRIGGIKFFADGALGSRTALMLGPYEGFPDDAGVLVDPPELVLEKGRRALELGFSPVVHAIGDRANREVLDVLEQLAPLARERGVRLRLEHAQHLDPADVPRFGRLGIVASVQPIHLVGDTGPTERLLGPDRAAFTYPFRSLIQGGATLALGSDAPVATPDPVLGWQAAVERRGEDGRPWHIEQALTPVETLAGYTTGAALAAGWDGWTGRIAPGFAADFTAWDEDPSAGAARPVRALSSLAQDGWAAGG